MDVIDVLVAAHREADPDLQEVWFDPSSPPDELRLVEVTRSGVDDGWWIGRDPGTESAAVYTFKPRPDLGIPVAVRLAVLWDWEWEKVKAGKMVLAGPWGPPDTFERVEGTIDAQAC